MARGRGEERLQSQIEKLREIGGHLSKPGGADFNGVTGVHSAVGVCECSLETFYRNTTRPLLHYHGANRRGIARFR